MSQPKNKNRLSGIGRYLTSTVSVALVLLILGIVGAIGIAGRQLSDNIRENLGFNLVMADDIDQATVDRYKQLFTNAPYVSSYEYLSADDILRQEQELIGEEDIVGILGVNPYQPEFNIKVKARYANVDSIRAITAPFKNVPEITEVPEHAELVNEVTSNLRTLSMILLAVAAALLAISFVLINNTVRLTIYSRRFLLHTMRLVGATASFIRRPIVNANIVCGLVAGLLASAILWGMLSFLSTKPETAGILFMSDMLPLFVAMPAAGVVICALTSVFATNKYLRRSYDQLF